MIVNANNFVYLISSTSGHIKIGRSNNPKRRLEELSKTSGPYEYELLLTCACISAKHSKQIEDHFHQQYSSQRANGEWFILYPIDLLQIGYELITIDCETIAELNAPEYTGISNG